MTSIEIITISNENYDSTNNITTINFNSAINDIEPTYIICDLSGYTLDCSNFLLKLTNSQILEPNQILKINVIFKNIKQSINPIVTKLYKNIEHLVVLNKSDLGSNITKINYQEITILNNSNVLTVLGFLQNYLEN